MTASDIRYSFGPVPSRRLGKSLGINNIPVKTCSYSCVYCQVGQTTRMQGSRQFFYPPEAIFRDVQDRLTTAKSLCEPVDYLTFVPDGEATLDVNLGKTILLLKTLDIPVGVITNSSLLWRDDVRDELGKADWVSLKIDAVQEDVWRQINRPHKTISLPWILNGILAFAKTFTGKLVTETMLVRDLNDQDESIKAIACFLNELHPYRAYLGIPTRPPALREVRGPDEAGVNRIYHILADRVKQVEYLIGYEGDAFASTGDIEKDILGITAVHPMRENAIQTMLSRAGSSREVIDRLVARGDLIQTSYEGHVFYLRKFADSHARRQLKAD